MPTASARWDIVSLIEHYANIQVVGRPSVVRGVTEVHSNCPWCPGSEDSFIMRPETGQFTHTIRSGGCDKTGDGIDFLMWYKGMERWEAIQELALENVSFYDNKPEPTQGQDNLPPKQWQETGKNFVERAARYLWGKAPAAQAALAYLRGRGLSDETIRRKKYGYCPMGKNGRWYGEKLEEGGFEKWGLKPEDIKDEKKRARGTLLIPPGIVIPWFEGDVLWKIEINRYDEPNKKDRYGQVLGSAEGLYNVSSIQYGKPVMIVENVYDADSVEQEAGDLVACIATGSAARGRSPRWTAELMQASFIIQSFDDDEGGHTGAVHWLNTYEKCFRFEPVGTKDPNDMLRQYDGKFVRDWVQAGLDVWECLQWPSSLPEPAPLARVQKATLQSGKKIETMDDWVESVVELFQEDGGPGPVATEEELEEGMAPHWQDLLTKVEHRANVLNAQEEFERLCISDRVETPQGPGRYWDPKQLQVHCERGHVRVTLGSGETVLFAPEQLEPVLEADQLSLAF
jgi:hypothetical protein